MSNVFVGGGGGRGGKIINLKNKIITAIKLSEN